MTCGQEYRKQAQHLGVLLALADENLQQRTIVLDHIRETMARLKRENPIFNARLFSRQIVRTAFAEDSQKESDVLAQLFPESASDIERVA
jgi:hypothetical protein